MDLFLRLVLTLSILVSAAACSGGGGGGGGDDDTDPPVLSSLDPQEGLVGTIVTLTGSSFGAEQGTSTVTIDGETAAVQSWSDTEIVVFVPESVYPGARDVVVTTQGGGSGALVFTVVLRRVFYLEAGIDPNQIEGYSLDGAAPAALPGSPWPFIGGSNRYGGYGESVAISRETRRLFSVSSEEIVSWEIDPLTGSLTRVMGLSVPNSELYGTSVSSDGSRLVTTDYDGTTHVLSIASNGTLAEMPGSPLSLSASTSHVAITRDGAFAYAQAENSGLLHGLSLTGSSVATVPGSPFASLGSTYDIEMAPDADRLYVALYTSDAIAVLDVQPDGSVVENAALRKSVTKAISLCFSGDGSRLFVGDFDVHLHVFDVNPATGELTAVAGSPFTFSTVETSGVACSQDGTALAVGIWDAPEYYLYDVNAAGVPTEVAGAPFPLVTTSGAVTGYALSF